MIFFLFFFFFFSSRRRHTRFSRDWSSDVCSSDLMSWFECPHCGKPSPIFGSGGGERLARELELPLLGQVPLDPRVLAGGDSGTPIAVSTPESPAARALVAVAHRVSERLGTPAAR